MHLPPKKRPGQGILASDWNTLIDALQARTPRPSSGMEIVSTSGGFAYRTRTVAASSTSKAGFPFAEIVRWTEGEGEGESKEAKTGIRGGVVQAGPPVWDVENKPLTLTESGEFLVWLQVSVTAITEDGVLLPGLTTSTKPEWKNGPLDGGYPAQKMPTATTPTGKAIVPIGQLIIEDGSAKLTPAYYGSVLITHCPGTLFQYRNGADLTPAQTP